MSLAFIEDQIFESLDFNKSPLKKEIMKIANFIIVILRT